MKSKIFSALRMLLTAAFAAAILCAVVPAANAAVTEELRQEIINCYKTGQDIDISAYDLSGEELEALFHDLLYSNQLPWYAARNYTWSNDLNTGKAVRFCPLYLEEDIYDRALYEQKVAEILDATVLDGMSQWQIALSIHDYLVTHFAYDETYTYYEGYDLLVRGTAVCNGYSYAYMDLLGRVGIQSVLAQSEAMDHVWNLVNIGGQWYHVDVTWDDPITNRYGYAGHMYFLKTDQEMLTLGEEKHHSWEAKYTCTDTTFQNAFWNDEVNSQVVYLSAAQSILRRDIDWAGYIRLRDETTGQETALYNGTTEYINIGSGNMGYWHTGMSMWNNRIFFSDMDTVYSMNPDGSDLVTEYIYDTQSNRKYIYSSYVDQDTLYLTLSDHNYNFTHTTVALTPTASHTHSYTSEVTPSTCLQEGYTTNTCSCGISYISDGKPRGDHAYESRVIFKASAIRDGLILHTCSYCGEMYSESVPRMA